MAKKLDISMYQTTIDGKVIMVADLTLEQLQQEVCYQMDIIEAIEVEKDGISERIQQWRQGKRAI